jgi:hypothetical protein
VLGQFSWFFFSKTRWVWVSEKVYKTSLGFLIHETRVGLQKFEKNIFTWVSKYRVSHISDFVDI